MPRNLDDFELERTPSTPPDEPDEQEEDRAPTSAEPTLRLDESETDLLPPVDAGGGGRLLPLILALLALLAFGVLAALYLVFRQPAHPQGAAQQAPVAAPAHPAPSAARPEAPPVPPLEVSDELVRTVLAGLSARPELARWLAQRDLVRAATAVVVNVVDGETPRPHLAFLAPSQRFRAKGAPGRRIVPDPVGFAGYDRFADTVASVDAAAAVTAFGRLEPLFEAAYRELGHPEGGFRQEVLRGIDALVATPVPPADAELVPHAIGFRWSDPRLEALTPAQKQFLRMGPRNVKLVQAKLAELRAVLGGAEATPPPAPGRPAP
ncbi:MAG TPA: DUF3014 domain-containing protein [Vicinamibacteria bacterium]|nr:DUF3014 domain-containing protein [Vicinamibacteria bacterium]